MQRRERQLHLRFDTFRAGQLEIWCRLGRITQERGLANAGLAPHYEDPAAPRPHVGEPPFQGAALLPAAPNHHRRPLSAAPAIVEPAPHPAHLPGKQRKPGVPARDPTDVNTPTPKAESPGMGNPAPTPWAQGP